MLHFQDHECQDAAVRKSVTPKQSAPSSKAAQAALARQEQGRATSNSISSAIRSSASSASNMLKGQSSIRSFFQNQPSTSASNQMLSEDEALARALQESMNEQQNQSTSAAASSQNTIEAPRSAEEQDLMLAQALAESQRDTTRQSSSAGNGDKSCCIS